MVYNKFTDDKPEFNQAALFVERLDKLSELIDTALVEGHLKVVYRLMDRIYTRIESYAEEQKDKDYLGNTFGEYKKKVEEKLKTVSQLLKKDSRLNPELIAGHLSEIDRLIYRIQWGLKLVFPKHIRQTFDEKMRVGYE